MLLAIGVTIYILEHQPAFSAGQSYYVVNAHFAAAPAVAPGQGQSINIAGVRVGQVGGVGLQDGQAVVQMDIEPKYAPIYANATVLLRPRTPLKDMYLSLDPGDSRFQAIPDGGSLEAASTLPDVNVDEILGSLDTDTRDYLKLLLAGGAQAFRDGPATAAAPSPAAVRDLSGTLKRFEPLARDTRTFAALLAERQQNLRAAVHNLGQVATQVGGVEQDLAGLITSADVNFSAIASQDAQLREALTLLPATLSQTTTTLGKVQGLASAIAPALTQLQPFARSLAPALKATQPFLVSNTAVIEHQLRPFSVAVQPLAQALAPGAAQLAVATPALERSVGVLNTLLNALAYRPGGGQQSYLFWGAWLSHIVSSLTTLQDANGTMLRGQFVSSCPELDTLAQIQSGNASLGALLDLLNPPDRYTICPEDKGLAPTTGTTP
jgi:phospholipid/cholesterol/gamma-HCH transport system substrate-binding protein